MRINEQMGLAPAGKRKILKGAGKTPEAAARTSRACPRCPHRWIVVNVIRGREMAMCAWCGWIE